MLLYNIVQNEADYKANKHKIVDKLANILLIHIRFEDLICVSYQTERTCMLI
jgi:hypothetical protein